MKEKICYLIIKKESEEQTLNSTLILPKEVLLQIAEFKIYSFKELIEILKEFKENEIFIIPCT